MAKTEKTTRKKKEVTSDFATPWMNAERKREVGESIEGVYMGWDNIPTGKYNKATGEVETFRSHRVKPEGSEEIFGLSGATLDKKLSRVPQGTYVWVTYLGQTLTTANGKAHDFKLEVEENVPLRSGAASDESSQAS